MIVEELGLFGALGLIGLYGILLWRGLKIASRAPDLLGSVMAAGLTFWIIIEAVINMAVMVGLLPGGRQCPAIRQRRWLEPDLNRWQPSVSC